MKPAFWCRSLSHAMGSECRDDPHGAIQSLLTYSGPIRNLNLSSTPIGRCFTRQKLVVDVVEACMDTIFSRQNYRSSLLRKSFFRGARDVGRRSVWRFSGHLDFFRFPHFPIQTQCSFFTLHTIQLTRKYSSPHPHLWVCVVVVASLLLSQKTPNTGQNRIVRPSQTQTGTLAI